MLFQSAGAKLPLLQQQRGRWVYLAGTRSWAQTQQLHDDRLYSDIYLRGGQGGNKKKKKSLHNRFMDWEPQTAVGLFSLSAETTAAIKAPGADLLSVSVHKARTKVLLSDQKMVFLFAGVRRRTRFRQRWWAANTFKPVCGQWAPAVRNAAVLGLCTGEPVESTTPLYTVRWIFIWSRRGGKWGRAILQKRFFLFFFFNVC